MARRRCAAPFRGCGKLCLRDCAGTAGVFPGILRFRFILPLYHSGITRPVTFPASGHVLQSPATGPYHTVNRKHRAVFRPCRSVLDIRIAEPERGIQGGISKIGNPIFLCAQKLLRHCHRNCPVRGSFRPVFRADTRQRFPGRFAFTR